MIDGKFSAGHETADAALFDRDDIPWDEIAFPSVEHALRCYFSDLDAGGEMAHVASVGHFARSP